MTSGAKNSYNYKLLLVRYSTKVDVFWDVDTEKRKKEVALKMEIRGLRNLFS